MRVFVLALIIVGSAMALENLSQLKTSSMTLNSMIGKHSDDEIFKTFHKLMNRSYSLFSELGVKKYNTFRDTLKEIEEHNSNPNNTWKKGITEFSDMTDEEFDIRIDQVNKYHMDTKPVEHKLSTSASTFTPFDWRDLNGVNIPTLSPNSCPSTSHLSMVSAIETCYFAKTGILYKLSNQQAMDCYSPCQSFGPLYDYRYFIENGLEEERDYPFTGRAYQPCTYKAGKVKVKPNSWNIFYSLFEMDVETSYATLRKCPYVAIRGFTLPRTYSGDVYNPTPCDGSGSFYGLVTVVGYGIDRGGVDYWVINPHMGPNWGDKGFMKVRRNDAQFGCGLTSSFFSRPNF